MGLQQVADTLGVQQGKSVWCDPSGLAFASSFCFRFRTFSPNYPGFPTCEPLNSNHKTPFPVEMGMEWTLGYTWKMERLGKAGGASHCSVHMCGNHGAWCCQSPEFSGKMNLFSLLPPLLALRTLLALKYLIYIDEHCKEHWFLFYSLYIYALLLCQLFYYCTNIVLRE